MALFKKTSPRRTKVRKNIIAERASKIGKIIDPDIITSLLMWLVLICFCFLVLSFELVQQKNLISIISLAVLLILVCTAIAFYIFQYQNRILRNHARAFALVSLFSILLIAGKLGAMSTRNTIWAGSWGTGTTILAAVIVTIAYDQRFAIGMGVFFAFLTTLALEPILEMNQQFTIFNLFVTMSSGVIICCFSLKEIRTRMKLLEVGALAALVVFLVNLSTSFLNYTETQPKITTVISIAGAHAAAAFIVGLFTQSLLPLIEKAFRIATSMTLLDYSDANQPLLKKLAMEAPGTFSHSLLIGSIAEAAAEAIRANGLLCRVGAYYHDIGKINKPKYFVENEMGSASKHKELSPAMSQLIIVGHVKDGVEMAREYALPAVLRQFIETHHGTTLVEPFYIEAKKQHETPSSNSTGGQKTKAPPPPSESEFRYAGPKPQSKEAAIIMLADAVEGAVRSLTEVTPARVETVVHNIAMKRLQDGQFDECDLTLKELNVIEISMSKILAAHYHGRIQYPTQPDEIEKPTSKRKQASVNTG